MYAAIPLSPDMIPNIGTVESLTKQGVEVEGVVAGGPGKCLSGPTKIRNIVLARNACFDKMCEHNFSIMNDNDCRHLFDDNFSLMLNALVDDPRLVAVALRKDDNLCDAHVAFGCILFSPTFWELGLSVEYHDGPCECFELTKAIRARGFRIRYLDDQIRISDGHVNQFV